MLLLETNSCSSGILSDEKPCRLLMLLFEFESKRKNKSLPLDAVDVAGIRVTFPRRITEQSRQYTTDFPGHYYQLISGLSVFPINRSHAITNNTLLTCELSVCLIFTASTTVRKTYSDVMLHTAN